ncbi:MAG: pilus assembly protein, partial [Deltaproteobacteria bacterium]|nr:pilus assembly protein [Deltaproteobacteria bacterium]
AGPLVAFLNGRDRYHEWVMLQWAQIDPPLLTCEAVLSWACFLLRRIEGGQAAVLELLRREVVHLPFRIDEHVNKITWLLRKYSDVPMSLADACLVRMSELYADSPVLTLDDDFRIYRKNKREIIPLLHYSN